MPALGAPIIAALIGLAGTGVTTGLEASGALTGGGGSSTAPQPTPAQLAQQVAQQRAQLTSTVNQNAPNAQEAGGGGLSPDYVAQFVANQTGTGTNINQLQDIISGGGGGTVGGATAIQSPSPPGGGNLSGTDIYG